MWDVLWWVLVVLYVPASLGLIVIVLLQKGKGTGFAGAFGIGAGSETVFGPQTAQGLPVKMTYIMATAFMVIALLMSIISGRVGVGAAPELEEETNISDTATTGLEEFGLGTGVTGQVDADAVAGEIGVNPPAEAETAPVAEAPEPEAPAPTADTPEVPDVGAPEEAATEAPDVEAPAADEAAPDAVPQAQ